MVDREALLKLERAILGYYPNAKPMFVMASGAVDEFSIKAWGAVLKDVSEKQLLNALVAYVGAGNKFQPNIGDLVEFVGKQKALTGHSRPRLGEWEVEAIRDAKAYIDAKRAGLGREILDAMLAARVRPMQEATHEQTRPHNPA